VLANQSFGNQSCWSKAVDQTKGSKSKRQQINRVMKIKAFKGGGKSMALFKGSESKWRRQIKPAVVN